ncbi:alpha/beta fold hydrolase [Sphingomonas canadensis]|uniref:Alpha/beta fold hydrolase n=1 Tax=Sphingomonas canadensis TaxID=1219257 RepID=A0ABW3H8Z5_9SPHN|nr:alpha/beta fold hydrolase [Sphingomonas canadensis]MCW3835651.1 alpha/beta fold hydrolase [Sphingomonas canadensis]
MTTFVMIHGAWHGGWSFEPLRARIEGAGHALVAPDLPGMGTAAPTLAQWGDFAAALCRAARPGKVILCGHSRGGIVVSQAAETTPEAIDASVYICAMLIPPGMSRADWKARQVPNPAFDAIIRPGPGYSTIDTAHAIPVFAQLSPPDAAADAMTRLAGEPNGPRGTPLMLTPERYGSVPRHYIECLHDRTIPIADQRAMQAMQPCASVRSLEADHSPFLSAPDALADALLQIAETVAQ